ncbi:MAG: hypothetical protein LUQ65_13615 [Candidatus Helarchaeota archaeon]|nr:hypothetical protein [Candidatus Helarchaeota archaeon]
MITKTNYLYTYLYLFIRAEGRDGQPERAGIASFAYDANGTRVSERRSTSTPQPSN